MNARIEKVIPALVSANITFLSFELQFNIFAYNLTYYQVLINNEPLVKCNTYNEAVHYCEENMLQTE